MKLSKVAIVFAVAVCVGLPAFAQPTRTKLYQSDRLKMTVLADSNNPNVMWYLPPVKLFENDGKVVLYKRPKGDKIVFYIYIVPYMTDDLIGLLAGELPGLQNKTQLQPVMAKQFGIQVKQFDTVAMGDVITDYQYLNSPQLIKVALPAAEAEDFEFFLQNKPGIQANVLFSYEAEKMDKYLTISLSHKEIYKAMNIGASGRYKFAKAEIASAVGNYVSNKYYDVKSKGDLPIPEIINKVIEECFTPYKKPSEKPKSPYRDWDDLSAIKTEKAQKEWQEQLDRLASIVLPTGNGGWDPTGPGTATGDWDDVPTGGGGGGKPGEKPTGDAALEFTFKKELANSEKNFYYKQEHFADTSETASIPVYLTSLPSAAPTTVKVTPIVKKTLVVEASNDKNKPVTTTGIMVQGGDQYTINAVFALQAISKYGDGMAWYRWQAGWPSVDDDLYYRVGTGPWNKVNGSAVVKAEGIYTGALQFYLDRESIWSKIPKEYKEAKMIGIVPAIFTFQKTYPQFNVTVTGRRVELGR